MLINTCENRVTGAKIRNIRHSRAAFFYTCWNPIILNWIKAITCYEIYHQAKRVLPLLSTNRLYITFISFNRLFLLNGKFFILEMQDQLLNLYLKILLFQSNFRLVKLNKLIKLTIYKYYRKIKISRIL